MLNIVETTINTISAESKQIIETQILPAQPKETVASIIKAVELDRNEFSPEMSFDEMLAQELPYLIKHGMTAFNCGYAGKKI